MSYTPTEWKAGDTVTSAKLNKLEQGVAGAGVLVVGLDNETGALDKTWQEIHDGGIAFVVSSYSIFDTKHITECLPVIKVFYDESEYGVTIIDPEAESGFTSYIIDSADGYPVLEQGPLMPHPALPAS